jgi:hypothetical protein
VNQDANMHSFFAEIAPYFRHAKVHACRLVQPHVALDLLNRLWRIDQKTIEKPVDREGGRLSDFTQPASGFAKICIGAVARDGVVTLLKIGCSIVGIRSNSRAAATTSCHACMADALKARCVLADVRWC